jgi:hypothetical protein
MWNNLNLPRLQAISENILQMCFAEDKECNNHAVVIQTITINSENLKSIVNSCGNTVWGCVSIPKRSLFSIRYCHIRFFIVSVHLIFSITNTNNLSKGYSIVESQDV